MPTIPKAILSHSVRNYSKTLAYYMVSKNMTGKKRKEKTETKFTASVLKTGS